MLLVCEGSKTEPQYFRSLQRELKLLPVEIEIVGQGAAPITVVQRAVEMRKTRTREVRHGRKDFGLIRFLRRCAVALGLRPRPRSLALCRCRQKGAP